MPGVKIGERLKAARKLRNIPTRADLAEKVAKPRFGERVLGQIERNEREAQPHEIEWISEALELAPSFFTEPAEHETQLDRIERKLDQVINGLDRVQMRLDAVDSLRVETAELLPGIAELLHSEDQEGPAQEQSRF